mmetsp:Transcript_7488/g.18436  ORF Transcript_7488/g.18436 Transcript_7488/m.18436 type:complete len:272 (-) Transcript_7488:2500-3315(-)
MFRVTHHLVILIYFIGLIRGDLEHVVVSAASSSAPTTSIRHSRRSEDWLSPLFQSQRRISSTDYQLGFYGRSQCSKVSRARNADVGGGGMVRRMAASIQRHCQKILHRDRIKSIFYTLIFGYFSYDSILSVWDDEWSAERDPEKYFSATSWKWQHERERAVVRRRVFKDRTIRKLVGAGYTPRLVFLYGIMLRGFLRCTALPKIFNPPIGWGAGSVVAAKFAFREWLPTILLGWYGSQYYWKLFSVNGPPKDHSPDDPFFGFPITIHKVQF